MLAKGFKKLGHRVSIVTRTQFSESEFEGIPVYCFPSNRELLTLAKSADILLQVEASWKDALPFILCRVPWFPTMHFGFPLRHTSLREKVSLHFLKLAFCLGNTIAVGDEVAKSWRIKTHVVANPYDSEIFHLPVAQNPIRDIDILFVGRIEASKGIFHLLESLKLLTNQNPSPLTCCFIGEGCDSQALQDVSQDIPHNLNITFTGRLPPEAVAGWMRRSRILAFPTTSNWIEASPLTPLEAIACGCRIVATDNGGTSENISPQDILIPRDSTLALHKALKSALSEKADAHPYPTDFLKTRHILPVIQKYLAIFELKKKSASK